MSIYHKTNVINNASNILDRKILSFMGESSLLRQGKLSKICHILAIY